MKLGDFYNSLLNIGATDDTNVLITPVESLDTIVQWNVQYDVETDTAIVYPEYEGEGEVEIDLPDSGGTLH